MSKKMIYHVVDGKAIGDMVNIWGHDMIINIIHPDDAVPKGWSDNPQTVINAINKKKPPEDAKKTEANQTNDKKA